MSLPPLNATPGPRTREPSPAAPATPWLRSSTNFHARLLRVVLVATGLSAILSCLPTASDEKAPPEVLLRTPSALAPDSISWTCPEAHGTASPAGATLSAHPEGVLATFPGLEEGCSDSIRLAFWKAGLVIARATYPPTGLQGGRLVRDPIGATLVQRRDSARTAGNSAITPPALLAHALLAGDTLLRGYPRNLPEGLSNRAVDSAILRHLVATKRPLSTLSHGWLSRDSAATDSLLQSWVSAGTITSAEYDALRNAPQARPLVVTLPFGLALLEDRGTDTSITASGPSPLTITISPRDTLLLPSRLQSIVKGPRDTWRVHLEPAPDVHTARTQVLVTITDGSTATIDSFAVSILAINDPPTFSPGPDIFVAENAPTRTIPGWATSIAPGPGNEQGQKLRFVVTPNDPAFYSQPPTIDSSGTLSFMLRPGARGVDTVRARLYDDGGTDRDGIDTSAAAVFTIATDRPPTLSPLADRTINEDDSTSIVMSVADSETPAERLTLTATSLDTALIAPSGLRLTGTGGERTLLAHPRANAYGQARIAITVIDASGLAARDTMTLFINSINDAPTLRRLADTAISEDGTTGPRTLLVDDAETDPAMLAVAARSTNTALIPQPSIVLGGTGRNRSLVVKPLPDQFGLDTIIITVTDGAGATTNDTIVVSVDPINDAPFFETTQDTILVEGSIQRQARAAFAKSLRAGPANESGQSAALRVSANTNPGLFTGPIEISSSGELSFTPDRNARGTATITITAEDQAGTAKGGVDRFSRTVDITVINTFTDARDGKVYRFVRIGSQVWLAQNLYTRPLQGEYVCFKDSCEKYGAAYTWSQAMALPDSCDTWTMGTTRAPGHCENAIPLDLERFRGLCPEGWHIPGVPWANRDWLTLADTVGDAPDKMKKIRSMTGWLSLQYNASTGAYTDTIALEGVGTDEYGLDLFPIIPTSYGGANTFVGFWEGTHKYPSHAQVRTIQPTSPLRNTYSTWEKVYRFPARCVKDR